MGGINPLHGALFSLAANTLSNHAAACGGGINPLHSARFRHKITLEEVIEFHAFAALLEALPCV
jgi:hypothetical protein